MLSTSRRACLALLAALLAFGPGAAFEADRDNLAGLGPVALRVLDPGGDRTDVTVAILRDAVADRLSEYKIPFLPADATLEGSEPYLRVRVAIARIDQYHYAYSVRVGVLDAAVLVRDPEIVDYVEIWESTETLSYALTRSLADQVRKELRAKLDQFVGDYLLVNPDP